MSYYDCALIPVAADKIDAYRVFSERIAAVYREYGALRVVDCLLDADQDNSAEYHAEGARDALEGVSLRTFPQAAATGEGEVVIVSWTEWPNKAVRDQGLKSVLSDPRVQHQDGEPILFEGRRVIAGGFTQLMSI